MSYNYCLIFLAILPVATFHLTKLMLPSRVFTYTGVAIGLVISPVSQGMLEFTIIPIVGVYIGFVGGLMQIIHGATGYFLLGALGIFEPDAVLGLGQLFLLIMVNGIIWACYYSFVGYKMDMKLSPQVAVQQFILTGQNLQHNEEF